jgi:hypothetical protein
MNVVTAGINIPQSFNLNCISSLVVLVPVHWQRMAPKPPRIADTEYIGKEVLL